MHKLRLLLFSLLVLAGMAGNSLLARAALAKHLIDPLSFTVIRLGSGAIILLGLSLASRKRPVLSRAMPFMLGAYALAFAYGYVKLGAATGTLFLFFSIQAAMLGWEIRRGYRLSALQWAGSALTLSGLWRLVGDHVQANDITGIVLMLAAGTAWAIYSILGRNTTDSLSSTTANFTVAALAMLPLYIAVHPDYPIMITYQGMIYSGISGAFTSALVYVLWYRLLKQLSGVTSAVMQMLIPVIVAVAAVPLLHEPMSARLMESGVMVLSGIAVVTLSKTRKPV